MARRALDLSAMDLARYGRNLKVALFVERQHMMVGQNQPLADNDARGERGGNKLGIIRSLLARHSLTPHEEIRLHVGQAVPLVDDAGDADDRFLAARDGRDQNVLEGRRGGQTRRLVGARLRPAMRTVVAARNTQPAHAPQEARSYRAHEAAPRSCLPPVPFTFTGGRRSRRERTCEGSSRATGVRRVLELFARRRYFRPGGLITAAGAPAARIFSFNSSTSAGFSTM